MTDVDHKYCFSYIDIGCNVWVSNGEYLGMTL